MKSREIWSVQLEPVVGHEQGRERPALIVSADRVNGSPAGLVTVLPMIIAEPGRAHRAQKPKRGRWR